MLRELGLDEVTEQVYRTLLDEPSMASADVADQLGLSQDRIMDAMGMPEARYDIPQTRFYLGPKGVMFDKRTGMPAFAYVMAMPPPMVPAPTTAARLIGMMGVSFETPGTLATARSPKKT